MISSELVDLSRLQFAFTSMYHFLFVPLTLGLSFLLVVMEACHIVTGRMVYKDMTRFWGKLFGISLALSIATSIGLLLQFGTSWAYYSRYAGDILGAPLLLACFTALLFESTLAGLFFFGWNRLGKGAHFAVTFFMALGTSLSTLWIIVANAWMQHPVGCDFNFVTMRMEVSNFWDIVTSPWAQAQFMHTASSGYMTGAMLVLAVSAWYLIRGRDTDFAKKSVRIASIFGIITTLLTLHSGDESNFLVKKDQSAKSAAMEAVWETHDAPAPLSLFALPDEKTRANTTDISAPWLLGLLGTRSFTTEIEGINPLIEKAEGRLINGQRAVTLLEELRKAPENQNLRKQFDEVQEDLGYGLLLKSYAPDVEEATPEQISAAALSIVPAVKPMYWSFRTMILCGLLCLLLFAASAAASLRGTIASRKGLLWLAALSLPLPWIASEAGWFVTEYGRQPWAIYEMLPVSLSVSSLSAGEAITSLAILALFYAALLALALWLMIRTAKTGPSTLSTGRYFFERRA